MGETDYIAVFIQSESFGRVANYSKTLHFTHFHVAVKDPI